MKLEKIVVGGGCFWCVEAVMQRLNGVREVVSGYAGGDTPDPDYRSVCSGTTGHAEVVEITFNPDEISLRDILKIFMTSHDPTTLNRQGADRGTQYRSIILYTDETQKETAQDVLNQLAEYYDDPIVTELKPLSTFYKAESQHQDYFNRNSFAGYCRIVISPKIAKLKSQYASYLKKD